MSAVMLKTAIYGMLRVTFDLLHTQIWWWGVIALAIGLATALFGVVFSAVQSDMKRLLAYSSIENIGFIVVGFGLTVTFAAYGMAALAALALTATLYHCLNHAYFKSLLFLATGSVLHATHERALGRLGGLIHRMPWVAWLALVGALATAGLPPLNGFVSEWLLLQAFLFTPGLPDGYLNMLVPLAAAAIALAAALSAYVMVKFYGVVFLGQPREERLAEAHDAGIWERVGLVWLAAGCVALGILPVQVVRLIDFVTVPFFGKRTRRSGRRHALAVPRADRSAARELLAAPLRGRPGRGHARRLVRGAPLLPRPPAPGAAVGLRLPAPHPADAGHRRGLRPAGARRVRAVLPRRRARAAAARRLPRRATG